MDVNQPGSNPGTPPPAPMQAPTPNQGDAHSNETLMGILSYLGILIIIPLVTEARHNPFVKFHIKQGLVLLIAEIILSFFTRIPGLGLIFAPILGIASLIMLIIGIMNVLNKKMKELPLIGHFASKFNF